MNAPDSSPAENPQRILLVEDTLDEALLVRTLLEEEAGCKVTLAQDGLRGCQLAEKRRWDLVVTDLNIPGRDGIEVIRASRKAHPETPILATTAYSGGDYVEEALRAGAKEVLLKPVDKDELLDTVRTLVVVERRASPEDGRESVRTILAVGALPGDVELGCGGIVLDHRDQGHDVTVFVFSAGGDVDGVEARKEEAREAARLMGVDLVLADSFRSEIPSVDEMAGELTEVLTRVQPDTLYTPSPNDVRESRVNVHEAGLAAGADVPNHYCYQAAATLDFRPTLFIDVTDHMDRKVEVLGQYNARPDFRPHLQPGIGRASARYWGRFLGYREVEPLEVVRSEI